MSRSFCDKFLSPLSRSWLRSRKLSNSNSLGQEKCLSTSNRASSGPHPFVPPEAEKLARALRQKGDKVWKEAASLIIATPNPDDKQKTDFLVMKRSQGKEIAN